MSRSFFKKKEGEPVPNLTPLIDVVFLLLIFFMVATTFDKLGGIKINLPTSKASQQEISKKTKDISVLIDKDKKIYIMYNTGSEEVKKSISKKELDGELKIALTNSDDKKVAIIGDKKLEYGDAVELMGIIKDSGAKSIKITSKQEN